MHSLRGTMAQHATIAEWRGAAKVKLTIRLTPNRGHGRSYV
jgi:hypothetical protein